jgi:4-amino-4-deoxy-L-arabinose transferase-like glycosyltransferase
MSVTLPGAERAAPGRRIDAPRGRLAGSRARARAIGERWSSWLAWLPLAGVVSLSLALNTWSLSQAGYGNTYYAAAVRSMTLSWKNFFFAAFDPGGFITVAKPPVFLWVGALSARVFGYSTWSLLLPSAFAGAASVALLWLIVRRSFGVTAATIAGLVLALTPVSVAVDRLNLPEPFMILALVGAAAAIMQSLHSRRWIAWTALAGALVGVAFNTKMLAAWIPGPAFALAIVAATPRIGWASARQTLARLAVLGVVTLLVSGSWLAVVDLWPASSRPYVGGSTDNTELNLALDYNGFGRVNGDSQGGGGGAPRGGFTAPGGGRGGFPGGGSRTNGGGFNGPGGIIGGSAGYLRMFDASNGGQIGWLLPFGLGAGLLVFRRERRNAARRAFALLFPGWVLLYAGVFSEAQGIFHSYYTSALAPGVAALVGVGAVTAAHAVRRDRRWLAAIVALVAVTAWSQLQIAGRTPDFYGWVRPLMLTTVIAGVALVGLLALRRLPVMTGVALSVAGLMLLPAAWSVSATANTSLNATLPQAGPQAGASGATFGSRAFDDGTAALASWLKAHNDPGATWQVAEPSAQNGSRLIAQYDVSVMALGGFLGTDPTITVAQFAQLVGEGKVRYVLTTGGGPSGGFRGFGNPFGRAIPGFGSNNGGGTTPGFGSNGGSGTTPGFSNNGRRARPGAGGTGANNGASGGGQLFPNIGGAGSTAGATANAAGSRAVMAAVTSACTPVTDPTLPAQYQNGLYDCAGASAALAAAVQ